MTNLEPLKFETERVAIAARPLRATWRYAGERDAADVAYCARFGATKAPEPHRALGGAWAYPLPETDPSR